jgi:hypothetical protein
VDVTRLLRDVNNERVGVRVNDTSSLAIKAEIKEWIKKEEGQYQVSTVAADVDPWLQYTGWEAVLSASKHDLVTTAVFADTATATEPELERVLQSWERIL